jgi:hypothetical protein
MDGPKSQHDMGTSEKYSNYEKEEEEEEFSPPIFLSGVDPVTLKRICYYFPFTKKNSKVTNINILRPVDEYMHMDYIVKCKTKEERGERGMKKGKGGKGSSTKERVPTLMYVKKSAPKMTDGHRASKEGDARSHDDQIHQQQQKKKKKKKKRVKTKSEKK